MRAKLQTTVALSFFAVALAGAEDIVHLERGGIVRGQIIELTDERLRVKVELGAGSSTRNLPMSQVRLIDFAPLPGEDELLAAGAGAPVRPLTDLWAKKRPLLSRPNSNAGEVGVLLGEILLGGEDAEGHANALNLFTIIEQGDWNQPRRLRARLGRLQALVRTGAAAEVLEEARAIAADGGDPALLLAAEYHLAMADLARLRELVAENPRWQEDDFARPEIEALYHDLLDRFLKPLLFFGTEEGPAADGLLAAGEVYLLIGQPDQARARLTDLQLLYPDSPAGAEAEALLKKLTEENSDEEDTNDTDG